MIVKHAKDIARQWVIEEASKVPGFYGAYYAGSVNWLPDDAILPATSDLDVWVAHTPPQTYRTSLGNSSLGTLCLRFPTSQAISLSHLIAS